MARHSDIAYVVVRFLLGNRPHLLLRKHPKWGDWSLVGGHVEPFEKRDWARAAIRETQEELAPLTFRRDFILLPLLRQPVSWGPVASRSAKGAKTTYTAQFFALRFTGDAEDALARIPAEDFVIVDEARLAQTCSANGALAILLDALGQELDRVPLASDTKLRRSALSIARVKRLPPVARVAAAEGDSALVVEHAASG